MLILAVIAMDLLAEDDSDEERKSFNSSGIESFCEKTYIYAFCIIQVLKTEWRR